ncbi:energy transducer TonB [Ideonella paludis]|uniref:energy transducer TonB n=1 Tax=Ideonella paludis TaxID=1233411 RepID=UPI003631892B
MRLGEQGTVLVRLVVDAQGLPTQVSLHKSSGHPRLDEQALQALRAARFVPYTRNGQALAWTAIAPSNTAWSKPDDPHRRFHAWVWPLHRAKRWGG